MFSDGMFDQGKLFIIDFGLCKKYKDENGQHIPKEENVSSAGTLRYESIYSQKRITASRRDDVISVGYMLLYYCKGGKLPWMGLNQEADQAAAILRMKENTNYKSLCSDIMYPEFE